jgi:hypothetical protein
MLKIIQNNSQVINKLSEIEINNSKILTELIIIDKKNNNENVNLILNNHEIFVSLYNDYLEQQQYQQIFNELNNYHGKNN